MVIVFLATQPVIADWKDALFSSAGLLILPVLSLIGALIALVWKNLQGKISDTRESNKATEQRIEKSSDALRKELVIYLDKVETNVSSLKSDFSRKTASTERSLIECQRLHQETDSLRLQDSSEQSVELGKITTEIDHLKQSSQDLNRRMEKLDNKIEQLDDKTGKGLQLILDTLQSLRRSLTTGSK